MCILQSVQGLILKQPELAESRQVPVGSSRRAAEQTQLY